MLRDTAWGLLFAITGAAIAALIPLHSLYSILLLLYLWSTL